MSIAAKLTTIAENEQKVHEAGKKAAYDEFWDKVQQNGERKEYNYAFAGVGWTNETFKPKYDIKPTAFVRGMAYSGIRGSLTDILNAQGIVLDTSGLNYCEYVFDSSVYITEIPHIVGNYSFAGLFLHCNALVTASISVQEKTTLLNTFNNCRSLVNLTIDGTIGYNGTNLSWSTALSKASITGIINALSDNTSGYTITLSQTAVNNAFGEPSNSDEWQALITAKSNWTISLV